MAKPTFDAPPANVYSGVYHALLWGMTASTVLFALGVLRALFLHPHFELVAVVRPSLGALAAGLAHLDPFSLMYLATLVLILTPVARVIIALIAFWVDRDLRFVAVTAVVLGVIALTVLLGELGLH